MAALVVAVTGGCVAPRDSLFGIVLPQNVPDPLRIVMLPPAVSPRLRPENLAPEGPWYERLLDGRGAVVTTRTPERDIQMQTVMTLTKARRYQRIVAVETLEQALALEPDGLLTCRVDDFRTVISGANTRYPVVLLLSPLFAQFWMDWITVEARLDWTVEIRRPGSGECLFQRHLSRRYYKTIPYALPGRFLDRMLGFLLYDATPEFICELMLVDTVSRAETDEPVPPGY